MNAQHDEVQRELEQLMQQRSALAARGATTAELDTRIAKLAGALGIDPSELAGLDLGREDRSVVGDHVVRRRFVEVIYVPLGIVLGMVVAALGQPIPGVAVAVGTIAVFGVLGTRRIARLSIDERDELAIEGSPVDWRDVERIDTTHRYPAHMYGIDRIAAATVELVFTFGGGRTVRFARGPWQRVRPTASPGSFVHLDRWLADRATVAGMTVERGEHGWVARR